jgi:hypothetical protein
MQTQNTFCANTYINNNAANTTAALTLAQTNDWEAIIAAYAQQHNIEHTHTDDECDVVVVYMHNNNAVAWLDCENAVGFVAAQ